MKTLQLNFKIKLKKRKKKKWKYIKNNFNCIRSIYQRECFHSEIMCTLFQSKEQQFKKCYTHSLNFDNPQRGKKPLYSIFKKKIRTFRPLTCEYIKLNQNEQKMQLIIIFFKPLFRRSPLPQHILKTTQIIWESLSSPWKKRSEFLALCHFNCIKYKWFSQYFQIQEKTLRWHLSPWLLWTLCRPDWPQTHRDPLACAAQVKMYFLMLSYAS